MANYQSMTVDQIQAFLNSKVPICDNYGTRGSTPTARRDYFASRGWPIPLTCLKDYTENGKTSAQIIYDTAQEFKINPQVLIVLLQKEQALVTDDWPDPTQFRIATGYGCPDTALCDSHYYGFTNQVRSAASLFRSVLNGGWTNYPVGKNTILYNPNTACGSSVVNIQNRATSALYRYTPYQPNQSALNAGWGSGDACGAYGNRNFYLYFNSWFGSTTAINSSIVLSKGLTTDRTNLYVGDTVTASYEVSNSSDIGVQAGGLGICARLNGSWYDFSFDSQNNFLGKEKKLIAQSKKLETPGTLYIFTCSYNTLLGGWANLKYPYNTTGLTREITTTVKDNPLITTGVSLSPANPVVGQPVTATFMVTNKSSNPININQPIVVVRDSAGNNVDFGVDGNITIPANSTYTYSKTRIFTLPGDYTFFISNYAGGNKWDINYPKSIDKNILRSGSFAVR